MARPTAAGGAAATVVRPSRQPLGPAATLDAALRRVPSVQVRQNSRGEAQFQLRGLDARQTAVLLDGVPLHLGWDGRADLSLLPVEGIGRIEVVRGAGSLLAGPNAAGGVVELSSTAASGTDSPLRRLRLGADQAGERAASSVFGAAPAALGAGGRVQAGWGLRDRPGFTEPGRGGDLRLASDLRHLDGFVSAGGSPGGGRWSAYLSGSGDRRGSPPELHVAVPRFWRYDHAARFLAAASATSAPIAVGGGAAEIGTDVGADLTDLRIAAYRSAEYAEVTGVERGRSATGSVRVRGSHVGTPLGRVSAAATYATVGHRERVQPGDADARYRQRLWSVAAEAERGWFTDAAGLVRGVRVQAGLARDGADTPESADKPALGGLGAWGSRAGATVEMAGGVRVHGSVGARARFPALRELYSGALGRFVPNPALRPERLGSVEAGITAALGGAEMQAVGFLQSVRDVVVRVPAGAGRFRRENRNHLSTTGLELLVARGGERLDVAADLLLQRARLTGAAAAPLRPEYQPRVIAGLDLAAGLPFGARGLARAEFQGRQWCAHPDLGRSVALPGQGRVDVGAGREWRRRDRRLGVSVWLDNAADGEFFDQCGLPRPGRTLRASLELR